MSRHLNEQQLTDAVAGLSLAAEARDHLATCLACRRQVTLFEELLAARRAAMTAEAPDLQRQRQQILDRLLVAPAPVVPIRQRRWPRSAMALAAVVLLAVAALVLYQHAGPVLTTQPATSQQVAEDELAVEEILAEVDAILADSTVPGFEPLGRMMPSNDELESYLHPSSS